MHRFLVLLLLISLATPASAAGPTQSNHGKLLAVPVPGKVVVAGSLDEWDLSGEMLVYNARSLRDRYAVRVHAMWDRDALYLGLAWRDPTPLRNETDADAAPAEGWMADAFQGRFVTDRQVHLTAWYSSFRKKSVGVFQYDSAATPSETKTFRGEGLTVTDEGGFQQAFKPTADGRGYTQEIRVPWTLLTKKSDPKAGLKVRFSGEYFWGGPKATQWPGVMWADPVDQKNPVRIVLYQSPQAWGELELLAKGNLPKTPTEDDDTKLQGPIPIRVEVPADATRFTLAIDDEVGNRVRNLASHAEVKDYLVPASAGGKRIVEVPWDGRADGKWDKERSLFLGDFVPAGKYTARVLAHSGVGVVHAGSFYNPGTPPWDTADGTGAWGYDHSSPSAVAAVPSTSKTVGRVFIGWPIGECGDGLIGLNAAGEKIWSWVRRGAGAGHLAASVDAVYLTFDGGKQLSRVHPDSGKHIKFSGGQTDIKLPGPATGLAVHGKVLAVAIGGSGKVLLLDADTGTEKAALPVAKPGSLAFTADGSHLFIISGTKLLRLPLAGGAAAEFPTPDVKKPLAVTTDATGQVYISDAESSVVRVLDAAGKLARTIGEAGGHRPGAWHPNRIGNPVAIGIETGSNSVRVWVAEAGTPRRVSVWAATDGKFAHDYTGNTRYSGSGGLLSDDVPTLGIVDGLAFEIDYPKHSAKLVEIMGGAADPVPGKTAAFGFGGADFGNGVHFLSKASGTEHAYFVEASGPLCKVFMKRGDRWRCVAALGRADHPLPAGFPKSPTPTAVFVWNDLDDDGFLAPGELSWFDPKIDNLLRSKGWGYRCDRTLTFYHSGFALKPAKFTMTGSPVYDPVAFEKLPGELARVSGDIYKTRFGYVVSIHDGGKYEVTDKNNVIHGLSWLTGFDQHGVKRWAYPQYWNAVHGALNAPMAMPGVIMGALKVTGVFPAGDRDIIALRGNIGQEFLVRDDGLYVGELFTDQRMAPSSLPPERDPRKVLGLPINDTSVGGEPFNGWIGRQRDGKVRMTYGNTDVRVAEVTGLDGLRELPPAALTITPEQIVTAKAFVPKRGVADGPREATLVRGGAFRGEATETAGEPTLVIRAGRDEVARAWLRADDTALHVLVRIDDPSPWKNGGGDPVTAFKTGDGVSVYVATAGAKAGGRRIHVAPIEGKVVAVVYRPDGPDEKPFEFRSPVRGVKFPHAAVEPTVTARATILGTAAAPRDYLLAVSVPWATLGVSPKSGDKLTADLGVLFGDDTGRSTARRVHWSDRETNVVNDLPTEAEFAPARWGTWIRK